MIIVMIAQYSGSEITGWFDMLSENSSKKKVNLKIIVKETVISLVS